MNLKIQSILFITILFISTHLCNGIQLDPEDKIYKEIKGGISEVNKHYLAPAWQPKWIEWRQEYFGKTKHEKYVEKREELELQQIEASTQSHKASELNSDVNTLLLYCQNPNLGGAGGVGKGDSKCKELVLKVSRILENKLSKYEEDSEEKADKKSS
jgi:hypothetical protein